MITDPDRPALSSEFHFHRLADKVSRDAVRRAAANARTRPVWLVNKAGNRIGAVVPVESARFLEEMAESLRAAEAGETVDLGSFAAYAGDGDGA